MKSSGFFYFICSAAVLSVWISRSSCQVIRGRERPGETCLFIDGVKGVCEELRTCMIDTGVFRRNNTVTMCAESQGRMYVCCRKPYAVANELCRAWKSYWRDNDGQCIFKTPLIVGGEEAGVGQFPHIAAIGIESSENRVDWKCGGTLISPHFVLTAAHCVKLSVQYVVRMGEHDLFQEDKSDISRVVGTVPIGLFRENDIQFEQRNLVPVEQYVKIVGVILHPEYDFDKPYNDIALLQLEKPIVMTKRVLPACLPTSFKEDFIKRNVTVAGWGRLKAFDLKLSPVLQKVQIPVIDNLKCWETLSVQNAALIPDGITSEQLCAGVTGKDACKGDSGGPLVLQKTPSECEHILAGVVSFGYGCGRFGVYTRVSSYVDWITGYIAPAVIPRNF